MFFLTGIVCGIRKVPIQILGEYYLNPCIACNRKYPDDVFMEIAFS